MFTKMEIDSLYSNRFFDFHIPKFETEVCSFLEKKPFANGKGVKIAIWDSGIDPSANGFQKTTDGEVKIIGLYDTTGSGDVDTSHVVTLPKGNGRIVTTLSDRKVQIPDRWHVDDGRIHLGVKALADLLPASAMTRITKDFREKQWDPEIRRLLMNVRQSSKKSDSSHQVNETNCDVEKVDDKVNESVNNTDNSNDEASKTLHASAKLHKKLQQEDEVAKEEFLKQCMNNKFPYQGLLLDIYVFQSMKQWRAVVDTSPYGGPPLNDVTPMASYSENYEYGTFPGLMSYSVNIYDNGNLLELVTTSSAHGTHVGSIAAGNFPDNPARNGVAPGAQLVSIKIGDSRLSGMETGVALCRAVLKTIECGCDIVNLSYGEPAMISNTGEVSNMINDMVLKHGIIFCSSSGNNGPALSTVGAPGSTIEEGFGIAPMVFPEMSSHGYSIAESHLPPPMSYTWASRGPSTDGGTGILFCAPGGAIASVPQWTLSRASLMNGSSMSSPNGCGAIALLLSAMKKEFPGVQRTPHLLRVALEATSKPIYDSEKEKEFRLSQGAGLIQVEAAYQFIVDKYINNVLNKEKSIGGPVLLQDYRVRMWTDGLDAGASSYTASHCRGIYLREFHDTSVSRRSPVSQRVYMRAHFNENLEEEQQVCLDIPIILTCDEPWVTCPRVISLSSQERSVLVAVDVCQLSVNQIHHTLLKAYHRDYMELGPICTFPITVVMPLRWPSEEPIQPAMRGKFSFTKKNKLGRLFYSFPDSISAIHISVYKLEEERESPNCVEPRIHSGRTYISHIVQLVPGDTYAEHNNESSFTIPFAPPTIENNEGLPTTVWESVVPLAPGQRTLEWCLARTWNQCGDVFKPEHELGYCIEVLGLHIVPSSLTLLTDVENSARLDIHCSVAPQPSASSQLTLNPNVTFQHAIHTLAVKSSETFPLSVARDNFPLHKHMYGLENKYSVELSKATEVTFVCPLLHNLLYESPLQCQMWIVSDENNRYQFAGDYHSIEKYKKRLDPGTYTIRLRIHHYDKEVLQKMKSVNLLMYVILNNVTVPATELIIRDSEPALLDAFLGLNSIPGSKTAVSKRVMVPGRHLQLQLTSQFTSKTLAQYSGATLLKGKMTFISDEIYKSKISIPVKIVLPSKKSSSSDSSTASTSNDDNKRKTEPLKPLQKKLKSIFDSVKKEYGDIEKQKSVSSSQDTDQQQQRSASTSSSPERFSTPQSSQVVDELSFMEKLLAGCSQQDCLNDTEKISFNTPRMREFFMCLLALKMEVFTALTPAEQQECVQHLKILYGKRDLRYLGAALTCAKTLEEMTPIASAILEDPDRHLILARNNQKNQDLLTHIDEVLSLSVDKHQLSASERAQLFTRALTTTGLAICKQLADSLKKQKGNDSEEDTEDTKELKQRLQTIFCELCCWNDRNDVGSINASKCVQDLAMFWWRHAWTTGYYGRALKILVALNDVRPSKKTQAWLIKVLMKLRWNQLAEWISDFYRHKYFKKVPIF